jgi:hypothetical protein
MRTVEQAYSVNVSLQHSEPTRSTVSRTNSHTTDELVQVNQTQSCRGVQQQVFTSCVLRGLVAYVLRSINDYKAQWHAT